MQTLYQHGTLATLMAGHLEGTATIDEVLQHGDSGIGTLTGSDGEVIYLEGRAFHANEFGEFKALEGNEMTPFSTITRFSSDKTYYAAHEKSDQVFNEILNNMKSKNLFSAIKITGTFKNMHVRWMPKQEPPYQRLIESARRQPEKVVPEVRGTIIGFYTPELFHGIGASGFHVHFIDEFESFGGHVLDFELEVGSIEIQNFDTFEQHLPSDNQSFLEADIDYNNIGSEISEAE
ncbi:acetolactate decarboxylase [Mammaliicoccus sp. JADD-157]|uniref:acetolactate decarboxylase n=1 Tax=Mammaliicoccus sp. JADD-157 TaxID=3404818 RepID=UPI003BB50A18